MKFLFNVLILQITFMSLNAQTNFEKEWKQVDSLILKQGLTETATKKASELYELARKEKNEAQSIKALQYIIYLQEEKLENASVLTIERLEKEAATARGNLRAILMSLQAEAYQNYLQQNLYSLYRITEKPVPGPDFTTWSVRQFHQKISDLYKSSIEEEKSIRQAPVSIYQPILTRGNSPWLRPTLYDILAHRALNYFQNKQRLVSQPASPFLISNPDFFDDAETFISINLEATTDSLSTTLQALEIFQQLIKFHHGDTDPSVLLDIDLQRIIYVYENAVIENKDSLYTAALQRIGRSHTGNVVARRALYKLSEYFFNKASTYDPNGDTTNRYAYLKAKEICSGIEFSKNDSFATAACNTILQSIHSKSLHLETESVNVPGKPFRMLVSYRNIDKLNFRIIRLPADNWKKRNDHWSEKFWSALLREKPFREFSVQLPPTGDHQLHRVETKVDALGPGQYALLSSEDPGFMMDKSFMSVLYFQVSGIAFFNKENEFFTVNRESGEGLRGVNVQEYVMEYDNDQRNYVYREGRRYESGKHGRFTVLATDKDQRYNSRNFEFRYNNDVLVTPVQQQYYIRSYDSQASLDEEFENYEKTNQASYLFTDRAIYRPGQTIHFRGIVVTRDAKTREPKIIPGFQSMIVLRDANYQVIDSLPVTTGKFGSYHGKFTLPSNLLNGQFSITDSSTDGQQYFSVEEYKRPSFLVNLNNLTRTPSLGDSITIQGHALAFAGNNINGGRVNYRVVRRHIIPFRGSWFSSRIWPPFSQSVELVSGMTTTDANGNFEIQFQALPDKQVDSSLSPVFHYTIHADVTDMAGETRSRAIQISAGYQSYTLAVNGPDRISGDLPVTVKITSANMNAVPVPTDIQVELHKLNHPDRILRNRLWDQPDQFIFSKEEFSTLFPNDIYKNEDQPSTWEKSGTLKSIRESSPGIKMITVGRNLSPGWYVADISAIDSSKEKVETRYYFMVSGKKLQGGPAFAYLQTDKDTLTPGETLQYAVHSNQGEVNLLRQEIINEKEADIVQDDFKNISSVSILKIGNDDWGRVRIDYVFVKNNRLYTDKKIIDVPVQGKELKVGIHSFRDKILPGSTETWKLNISNPKGIIQPAEIASVIYDESLDEFRFHSWQAPALWVRPLKGEDWMGGSTYQTVGSFDRAAPSKEILEVVQVTYPQLYFHPESLIRSIYGYDLRTRTARAEAGALQNASIKAKKSAPESLASVAAQDAASGEEEQPNAPQAQPIMRKDFRETAAFIPSVETDEKGNASITFTVPEALTRWKWMTMAHTESLAFGTVQNSFVTQKPLMVQPNMPRFLREGDRVDLRARIINLTEKEMTGQVELQLIDPQTNESIDGWFRNFFPNQYFTAAAGETVISEFSIEVPFLYGRPVIYKIFVRSDSISDGETAMLPVLTNRKLVTESLHLSANPGETKNFRFEKLLRSTENPSLSHHSLTVEYNSNPVWTVIQTLPYLQEIKDGSADQVFNRIYANLIGAKITRDNPRIAETIKSWKAKSSFPLSPLEENQDLKSVLLQQTPWVLEAKNETERTRQLAFFLDSTNLNLNIKSAIEQLKAMQKEDGSFSWMSKGPSNRHITQSIVLGIGRLFRMNAVPEEYRETLLNIAGNALLYTDESIDRDYREFQRSKSKNDQLQPIQLHYLYMRSYFSEPGISGKHLAAVTHYRKLAQKQWPKMSNYSKAMATLFLNRTGDNHTASQILRSLEENALIHPELGMYWKETSRRYYWYQSSLEAQAVLIEAFDEMKASPAKINALKTWLIRNKQTSQWDNSRSTVNASYALLLRGEDWTTEKKTVIIRYGDQEMKISPEKDTSGVVTGNSKENYSPGYKRVRIEGKDINPSMGNISVTVEDLNSRQQPSWGAVYWQYFEDMDMISKPTSTPLSISKEFFVVRPSAKKENTILNETAGTISPATIQVGDELTVRIILKTDRDLEYVHLSDLRAAGLEPVEAISGYEWRGGAGYYQSAKDASMEFYFDYLPRGQYILEYKLRASATGTFSNGLSTVQCMYAPEFTSHTEGSRIMIEKP